MSEIEMPCENGCCWLVTHPVGSPPQIGSRTCFYCDADREPRECGEPCPHCGGPEE